MESPTARLVIVALLACAGCSPAHQDSRDLPATTSRDLTEVIPFDDQRVVFYWEGVRIHSPAHITMVDQQLVINGVRWKEPPPDTLGADAGLSKHFRGVLFVDSLVASGSSWLAAVNAYGLEMPRRLRRAVRQLRAEQRARGEPDTAISIPALATLLDVPVQSVWTDGHSVSCKFPPYLTLRERLDAPDSVLARDAWYRPPQEFDEGRHFRWLTSMLRTQLLSREPRLLIEHQFGTHSTSMRGELALKAQGSIERAIQQGGDVDIQELARTTGLTRYDLAPIFEKRAERDRSHR